MAISHSEFPRIRNISDQICLENQTHILCSTNSPPPESRAVCQIRWKNIAERGRPQMAIWRVRIVCWILEAKRTH